MARVLKITVLGSGSSRGVPKIGGNWGQCDPTEPKNRRRRASLLVEIGDPAGPLTTVLIDTSPDLREQLLDAEVNRLDAVFYTHDHADQTHGIDDLRQIAGMMRARVPVYGDELTLTSLRNRFGYCFGTNTDNVYSAILEPFMVHESENTVIEGPGGPLTLQGFELDHGVMPAQGFLIEGRVAYSPDVVEVTDRALAAFSGIDCWICDALRWEPHITHAHVDKSLGWFEHTGVKRGVLTNLDITLDYATLGAYVPDNVDVAYDGMELRYEIP